MTFTHTPYYTDGIINVRYHTLYYIGEITIV